MAEFSFRKGRETGQPWNKLPRDVAQKGGEGVGEIGYILIMQAGTFKKEGEFPQRKKRTDLQKLSSQTSARSKGRVMKRKIGNANSGNLSIMNKG